MLNSPRFCSGAAPCATTGAATGAGAHSQSGSPCATHSTKYRSHDAVGALNRLCFSGAITGEWTGASDGGAARERPAPSAGAGE